MKTLEFTQEIKAPAKKVWDILWNETTYPQWTEPFNPGGGSTMQTDWQVGGKTLFLDGKGNGMVSTIKTKSEPYDMVFEHRGEVVDGKEDTTSAKVMDWAGSLEAYHLSENEGVTTLKASVQVDGQWEDMMNKSFPKALKAVKNMAEQ